MYVGNAIPDICERSMHISTREAASIAARTIRCIRYWLISDKALGKKVKGRWAVDRERLEALLSGNML